MNATDLPSSSLPIRPCPLWATLAFTFINSIGTGVVMNGIVFLAREQYAFSRTANYMLALLIGLTYIPSALFIGPALRRAAARNPRISTGMVLWINQAGLGLVCFLPILARTLADPDDPTGSAWSLWMLIMLYSPLCGILWPITESYLSGGRSGANLRSAVGRFNIVWAVAVVVAFWAMGPVIKKDPLAIIAALGVFHLLGLFILPAMGREPARHIEEHHEPHPAIYTHLLTIFRFELPASYIVMSALGPFMPTALEELEVDRAWQLPLAATWMATRIFVFLGMERWHGWHGRRSVALVAGVVLLSGFALCLLAPPMGPKTGLPVLVLGLILLGSGIGAIYAASLYYALEVGKTQVDAGGKHEALIGMGYTVGPACGLAASGAAAFGVLPEESFEAAVLGSVGLMTLIMAAYALHKGLQNSSPANRPGA